MDVARFAQEYAAEVRVFVEARMAALFDDPAYSVSLDPLMLSVGRLGYSADRSKAHPTLLSASAGPIVAAELLY
ncbi:MAG: hypothetical protein ACREXP_29380 [Steroidobacteraceae bacterium]